jgi:hypothetical protein
LTDSKAVHQLDIPLNLDVPSVIRRLNFHGDSRRVDEISAELEARVRDITRPRAVYTESHPVRIGRDFVDIDGIRFKSRILNKALANVATVYPFIATIGKELDELKAPPREMLQSFSLDAIKTEVLIAAVDYLTEYLKEKFNLSEAALINPGELKDWPLAQQIPLFQLFGGREKNIGASVSRGGAMRPLKSRSGLLFPDDTGFISCRLCTQEKCPGRRAAYNAALVEEYLN